MRIDLENENTVYSTAFSTDGRKLAVSQIGDYEGRPNLTVLSVPAGELSAVVERQPQVTIPVTRFGRWRTGMLYYSVWGEGVRSYDVERGKRIRPYFGGEEVRDISVSSEMPFLLASGRGLELWNTDSQEQIWHLVNSPDANGGSGETSVGSLLDDGRLVVVAGNGTDEIQAIDHRTGSVVWRLPDGPKVAHRVVSSPDGKYLVVIGALTRGMFVWDLDSRRRHRPDIFNRELEGYWSVCFDHDGRHIVVGSIRGFVGVYDLHAAEILGIQEIHGDRVRDLALSPDGRYVACAGDRGAVHLVPLDLLKQ